VTVPSLIRNESVVVALVSVIDHAPPLPVNTTRFHDEPPARSVRPPLVDESSSVPPLCANDPPLFANDPATVVVPEERVTVPAVMVKLFPIDIDTSVTVQLPEPLKVRL
jgi:hypothetical protein